MASEIEQPGPRSFQSYHMKKYWFVLLIIEINWKSLVNKIKWQLNFFSQPAVSSVNCKVHKRLFKKCFSFNRN